MNIKMQLTLMVEVSSQRSTTETALEFATRGYLQRYADRFFQSATIPETSGIDVDDYDIQITRID